MAVSTYDEAYSIPSEKAQRIALRTQQIVALETGICSTPDPLGGSCFGEALTGELEGRAGRWMDDVRQRGGMRAVTESGWAESILAEQAYRIQGAIERGEREVVGVNVFTDGNGESEMPDIFRVDPQVESEQISRLKAVKEKRDAARLQDALTRLEEDAAGEGNLLPAILDVVRAEGSEGDVFRVLRAAWGDYRPGAVV